MKKRKQWIAMLFMLAMLLTVMPLATFAEGENLAPQGNEWTGEWDDMQVNVLFGLGNDDIGAEIYKSERWENAPKNNLTPEELTALKDFYDNLLTDATFEWQNDGGKWVKFKPTKWEINKYAPHLRSIKAPKGKKVRMTVPTSKLPKDFSLGEFQDRKNRAYIGDPSEAAYSQASHINLYAIKYKVKFDAGKGAFPNKDKTYECFINSDGVIKYPDKPTRDGYVFNNWQTPIHDEYLSHYKELQYGGGVVVGSKRPSGEEPAADQAITLIHGKTNIPYLWTYNHFYWAYERTDTAHKHSNPRTVYAVWERPTLTFYKDPDTSKTDVLKSMKAYNGKSLNETDWDQNTDLTKITELPKATAPAGMRFKGWVYYDANNKKHDFDMKTTVDGNMKLYPVFKKTTTPVNPEEEYTITVDPNGGNWNGDTAIKTYKYKKNRTFILDAAPEREGYKFLYWKGSEYQPGEKYTVKGDHTFTAEWKKEEVKPEPKNPSDNKNSITKDTNKPKISSNNSAANNKTPQTGYSSDIMLYTGLAVLMSLGVLLILKKKKNYK